MRSPSGNECRRRTPGRQPACHEWIAAEVPQRRGTWRGGPWRGDKNVETTREFLRNCLGLVSPKEHQANGVQDDLEILQLVDQRNAAIFERLIHGGISGSARQEHDPVS